MMERTRIDPFECPCDHCLADCPYSPNIDHCPACVDPPECDRWKEYVVLDVRLGVGEA